MTIEQSTEGAPKPHREKMQLLASVSSNVSVHQLLFDERGHATDCLRRTVQAIGLRNEDGQALEGVRVLTHQMVEDVLQQAFFKKNAALFSFQVAEGEVPSQEQYDRFVELGLVEGIRLAHAASYDVGVVFGGLLGAVEGRIANLLQQGATLRSIALLGGKRQLFPDRECGEKLARVIGEEYYAELEHQGHLPNTEAEMMACVWNAFARRDPALRELPVVTIDSQLRLGKIKEAPGTPETVVDLVNTLTSETPIPGLESPPSSFLLSSSQPHGVRQLADFLSSFAALRYPLIATADVVAYPRETPASLMLYGQELAKLVHAQLLARYDAV